MKNACILIFSFCFLLSCNQDTELEVNSDSNIVNDNSQFWGQIGKNDFFLQFVEVNMQVENLILLTLEKNQLTPYDLRQLYNNQNEVIIGALFKDTDLVKLSKKRKEAVEGLIFEYPDLRNRFRLEMSDVNKQKNKKILFPFLDQNQTNLKCSSTAEWVLFQTCLALTGLGATACFVNATLLLGPVGPYICSLAGSALGAACYYNACIASNHPVLSIRTTLLTT